MILQLSAQELKDKLNLQNGVDGKQGIQGTTGSKGKDGKNGLNGENGKDGSPDTAVQIADKLNTLEGVIEQKVIIGLEDSLNKKVEEGVQRGGGSGGIFLTVAGAKKGKVNSINFAGMTYSKVNGLDTITAAGGSQTPWTSDINGGGFALSNVSNITDTGLTATRVTFAGTGGLLSDDTNFTFTSNLSPGNAALSQKILNFSQGIEVASNYVVNGDFSFGNLSLWTAVNVVYSSGAANYTATGAGGVASLSQTASGGFIPLRLFPYSYTITNYSGDKYHYLSTTSGGAGAKRQGNGTFTGWLLMTTSDVISITLSGGTATTTMTIDNISVKNPQVVNGNDVLIASRFYQNGYGVIDTNNIGGQSVAYAASAGGLSGALTSPLTVNAGDENATLQMNTTGGNGYYLSFLGSNNINGGLSIGVKDQANNVGTQPTFGMSAYYTLYSGPLTATLTMGDINSGNYYSWNNLGYGSFSYTTDNSNTFKYSFTRSTGAGEVDIDLYSNGAGSTIVLPNVPTSPTGLGNYMFLTDMATAIANNYNVVCMG